MHAQPSHAGLASLVQSQGRGDDSMLVHMTPQEVGGLRTLAMAAGGDLKRNPRTGLYEAGFLKSLLPTILGAVLAPFTGGLSAAMIVGAGTGLVEKDWKKGLLAGLGAFGGAGLGSALAGTGASTAAGVTGEALKEASKTAAGNIMNTSLGAGTGVGNLANMGRGLTALGSSAGREAVMSSVPGIMGSFGGKAGLAAAAAPMMFADQDGAKMPGQKPLMYYTGAKFHQTRNPNWEQGGDETYFNQSIDPGYFTTTQPTGPGMADGGEAKASAPADSRADLEQYYRSMLAPPTQSPAQKTEADDFTAYMQGLNKFVTGTGKTSPTYVAPPPKPAEPPQPPQPTQPTQPTKPTGPTTGDDIDWDTIDLSGLEGMGIDANTYRQQMKGLYSKKPQPTPPLAPPPQLPSQQDPTQFDQIDSTESGAYNPYAKYQPGMGIWNRAGQNDGTDIYSGMINSEMMNMNPSVLQFSGGGLGSFSDGGHLLKGPGDGMSDSIPAEIRGRRGRQPARLADGEFVVPADVVSHLGNGSTDAGAKKLYDMMSRVRRARTKTSKQAKPIKADRFIPR